MLENAYSSLGLFAVEKQKKNARKIKNSMKKNADPFTMNRAQANPTTTEVTK